MIIEKGVCFFSPNRFFQIIYSAKGQFLKILWSKFLCVFQTLKGSYLVSLIMHARALKKFTFKVTVFFPNRLLLRTPIKLAFSEAFKCTDLIQSNGDSKFRLLILCLDVYFVLWIEFKLWLLHKRKLYFKWNHLKRRS